MGRGLAVRPFAADPSPENDVPRQFRFEMSSNASKNTDFPTLVCGAKVLRGDDRIPAILPCPVLFSEPPPLPFYVRSVHG